MPMPSPTTTQTSPLVSTRIDTSSTDEVRDKFNEDIVILLPPKLYLVVFYQVSLVNQTRITCSDCKRPLEVLLGSACCTISHAHTPWGNCNKCSSMIASVKDSAP